MDSLGLSDYLAILKRRRLQMAVPAAVILAIAVVLAFALPPIYRSTATVLIEEPDIPKEMVRSTVTSYAEQRLQQSQQKMTAMSNLVEIITKYNLYETARQTQPMTEVAEKMKKDITLTLVNAAVADRVTGRTAQEAIAFTLGFDHNDPLISQKVANEILSRFLEEDLKARRDQTKETTQFLMAELKRLEEGMAEIERRMAQFKAQHAGGMPEDLPFNMQMAERASRDMQDAARQLQVVDERRADLRGQLAGMDRHGPVIIDGQQLASPRVQLKSLQARYTSLTSRYAPNHPDVIKARREIEALERELGLSAEGGIEAQLDEVRVRLAAVETGRSADHPDVLRLRRQVQQLERDLAQQGSHPRMTRTGAEAPDNPLYLQFQAQLDGLDSEARSLGAQREEARRQRDAYEVKVRQIPQVEREWSGLKRDYDNAVFRYKDLKDKEMAAGMAEAMEQGRKAERLTVIEPPLLPEKPVKPPRMLIVALGLVLAVGGGIGVAAIAEAMSQGVHGSRHIEEMTGMPPLVSLPYMQTMAEAATDKITRRRLVMGAGVAVVAMAVVIDTLVMPLEVVVLAVARRLGFF